MKKSNYTGTDVEYEVEKEKKFVITRGMVILAIVVLIFIIAIIFIVSKLTENNNYSLPDYVQLESRMEEEAPIYISQNKIEIDTEPYKIMLKDLLYENGGTISLPVANECVGYVVAEKKETVEYKAYIKCNDSYITEGYKNEEPNVVPTTTAIHTTTAKDTVKPNILIIGEKQVNLYVGDTVTLLFVVVFIIGFGVVDFFGTTTVVVVILLITFIVLVTLFSFPELSFIENVNT